VGKSLVEEMWQVAFLATGRAIALGTKTAAVIQAAVRFALTRRSLAWLGRGAPPPGLGFRRRSCAIHSARRAVRRL